MGNRIITVREKSSEELIAEAVESEGAVLFEGAWYFDRAHVRMNPLLVTERTYICPYKGVCYWIDLAAPDQQKENVGFTYFEVNPGYEFIRDKIGFYAGDREATIQRAKIHETAGLQIGGTNDETI